MPITIATIRADLTGAPSYRLIDAGGKPYASVNMGPLHMTCDDPTELRRLADVLANAADVLEQAQKPRPVICDADHHDFVRTDRDFFATMPLVGYQDDGANGQLELRNCHCGTTLARPVEAARGGMAVAR